MWTCKNGHKNTLPTCVITIKPLICWECLIALRGWVAK